jgi:glutaminyl-tRNA synthetase
MNEEKIEKPATEEKSLNFLQQIIKEDLENGRYADISTRFPPEPNGYLHIGHAKSICLNFGLAQQFGGKTNLRFDDTNPVKEETEYVDSIKNDVQWLGFQWAHEYYTSDYFGQLYDWAIVLINKGLAYVDDQTQEEIRQNRGTVTQPGIDSPYRNRSMEENLSLFQKMKAGEFEDGAKVLRAKIDMAHPNMLMRDPILYRIIHAHHHRTGNQWCIYPMYDYAHGQSDSIEQITHSICTLEFDIHRPLYDWFIEKLEIFPSHQYEFARLNLTYTVMSKRKLLELVKDGFVSGWDDPRMPTICGLRRRGYTPQSIRTFCDRVGVARRDNTIDIGLLEYCIREDLNMIAPRVFAVLDPLKIIITNYPEGKVEEIETENNPENEASGRRKIPFCRELYIERNDFEINPPKNYFRLAPEKEVRLKGAYIIKCDDYATDSDGKVTEVYCTYYPETKSGMPDANRKVKGTLHWVSNHNPLDIEVRLYDRLFMNEDPASAENYVEALNPASLTVLTNCKAEPSLAQAKAGDTFQFQRLGYFCIDPDSTPEKLVFNRTVSLKDAWAKKAGGE